MPYLPAQDAADGPYTVHFNSYEDGGKVGKPESLEVDAVIGADGANSRVAKEIDAGEYDYAIAFQERIRIPEDKMDYYKDLAEMYVGDDVSPDFYGWVFPKYDHVAVGAPPAGPGLLVRTLPAAPQRRCLARSVPSCQTVCALVAQALALSSTRRASSSTSRLRATAPRCAASRQLMHWYQVLCSTRMAEVVRGSKS